MKKNYSIFFKIFFLLLGFIFFPTLVASILFIFNISINIFILPISIILLILLYYKLFYNRDEKKLFYLGAIISILIVLISILLSFYFIDNTYDGWSYHVPAIIKLKDGWNPLYVHDENMNFGVSRIWSIHYPKFIWIYSSILYMITGNIFTGTSFNLILTFATFFLLLDILCKYKKNILLNICLSFVISFNVITVGQLFTYYNDGVLGLCVISLLFLLYSVIKNFYLLKNNYTITLCLAMLLSILSNIKFNGALFSFIIFLIFLIYYILQNKKILDKFMLKFCLIIGGTICIISLITYLPNFIYHRNIGYPIIGNDKIDIITEFVPKMVKNDNSIVSFLKSNICDATNLETCKYKSISNLEIADITRMGIADNGVKGFGPFYFIILFLSLFLFLICFFKALFQLLFHKYKLNFLKKLMLNHRAEFIVLIIIILFFFCTPAQWWCRYVPYMYSLPLIITIFFSYEFFYNFNLLSIINYLIFICYVVSIVLFGSSKLYIEYRDSRTFYSQIKELQLISEKQSINQYNDQRIGFISHGGKNGLYKNFTVKELFKNNNIYLKEYEVSEDDNKVYNMDKCLIIKYFDILEVDVIDCNIKEGE